ncbi:MAG: bifunctional phosphopantothenoylcysteine decarboxylase/phosphopantothenate--cysteine ligase CoaBC [Rhizobiales bacterium]|nr:bifunctional phosphopantothenoylcysteine decarboxylase/phosphopantothenate--cysteine ligase CoaBC [Hyphomicrobiales bacterium]
MVDRKRILLIIGGGIAAYKCLELIRRLKERGIDSRVIMTRAAAEFVTPLSVATLCGEKAFTDLFDLTDETEIGHIELSRSADLVVVAPATADLMARMATGQANDLATTALLATDKPVLIAPAMNVRMWQHAATQRNLAILGADGVEVVGPNDGDMACGEFGPGRMAEPAEIISQIETMLGDGGAKPLAGRKVLITAGPTHEPIDPVRYIANRSSGRQGYAIARAAERLGARTILVSGPVHEPLPPGVEVQPVETANEMLQACQDEIPADIAIFAAAVADWRAAHQAGNKLKKDGKGTLPSLELTENPDVLATIAGAGRKRPQVVVGFAAETENVIENAKAKLIRKKCDLIVANDVSEETGVMGGAHNTVHLVSSGGVESWPEMSKDAVAERLMQHLANLITAPAKAAE